MSTKISFPSRSNAFTAVKATSARRDSIQPGTDQNGVKRIKLSFPGKPRQRDARSVSLHLIRCFDRSPCWKTAGPARPAFDPDQAIKTLTDSFPAILSDKPLPAGQTLESLFTICQQLVAVPGKPSQGVLAGTQKVAKTIYDEAVVQIKQSVSVVGKDLRSSVLAGGDKTKGTGFLRLVLEKWAKWETCSIRLISILLHLDRTFVLQTDGLDPLRSVALRSFKESVLEEKIVQERCLQAITGWIDGDRKRHDASS